MNIKSSKLEISFSIYNSLEELPENIKTLMQKAISARENAYAPYSHFKVGAATLLENNSIVIGNNQENAAYPSGLCAERVAIYHASAQFPNVEIKAMAISGSGKISTELPVSPCGSCRQAIAEYEIKQKKPISIYFMGAEGKIIKVNSIKDLLPFTFDGSLL